jgi:hypothetical protein
MNGINTLVDNPSLFKAVLLKTLDRILEEREYSWKKAIAEEIFPLELEPLDEGNIVKSGRIKLIRRRIRKGKLQRNIRKSAVKGWTLRGKKLIRIPAAKRVRMRIVAKRSARKRKGKLQNILRKRRMSLRKRKSMGIK